MIFEGESNPIREGSMSLALLVALLIVFFAVAFSLQNSVEITIQFFAWTFQGSLVLVLLTTLALGVIISLLATMPSQIKKNRLIAKQNKTIEELEQSLSNQQPPPFKTGTL